MPKLKNVQALICDCDGVLVDSFLPSVEKHQNFARLNGFRVPSIEECAVLWGGHWEEQFVPALWPGQVDEFIAKYKLEMQRIGELVYSTFEGLPALLAVWSNRLPLCVVTNRDRKGTLRKLELARIDESLFGFVQGCDDIPYRKPDPRVFDKVWSYLQQHGVQEKENVAYAGDTLIDYQAATNFGFPFIGVASFPTAREKFLSVGVTPDHIVDSPVEIDQLIS
jgi:HAD superfamily hydrolase (TIGR01549 family)